MDQIRPRIFISSVIEGFEGYREAAASGVDDAGAEPVMVERFPSLNVSPRTACLDGIDSSDGVIVIVGQRAGFKTQSGKYVVEEEWLHARKRSTPIHVFVQDTTLEPDADRIAKELSEYVHGRFRRTFNNPEDLRGQVAASLNGIVPKMNSALDTRKLMAKLSELPRGGYETLVRFVIQPVRTVEVIDPLDLDSRTFQNALLQLGTEGETPLFSLRAKKNVDAGPSSLHFSQPDDSHRDSDQWYAGAELSTDGFLWAERTASSPSPRGWSDAQSLGLALKLADLEQATSSLFEFAAAVYNRVDSYIACRDFVFGIALVNLGMRYIYDAIPSGQGMSVRMSDNSNILAFDTPRLIVREALDQPTDEIKRSVALLRRRAQPGV